MLTSGFVAAAADLMQLGLDLTVETINLIYEKQRALKEGKELCASLTKRIVAFVNELHQCAPETFEREELLGKFESLLKDFLVSIVVFSDLNLIQRVLKIKQFEEDIKKYNEQLDRIMTRITIKNADKLAEMMAWRTQFGQNVLETLKQVKLRDIWNALNNMSGNAGSQKAIIKNVLLEVKREIPDESDPDPERAPEPREEVLRNIIIVGQKDFLGGKEIRTPPSWLIGGEEVVIKGDAIDAKGSTSIFIGEWQDVPVALKKFNVVSEENPVFDKHFIVWHSLHHPYVAQLYGAGSSNGAPFFVYEYASRQSLDRCWETLAGSEILLMLHQAALGLKYLHSKSIVHGNVNCSRLLVTEHSTIKLFGFNASYFRQDGKSNSLKVDGQVEFAAPECLGITQNGEYRSDCHSPRFESDVYSLGLTILEAMTRRNPFHGLSSGDPGAEAA
ncbi:hypothetical protein Poli38472_001892 [Pythium oligandrum]|uniref:Protein kinase domain-containing protein n=1 Tax=Pythium oligandrum TaxID=41045 RepID=A0A8K1FNT5_PYTOL|nr:hypothetical protein Poli38472_001892 [Pythium oligandrum]|eukprot:TMW69736.1 hypothetical protein Poli38472_001892 [Pythium oligandrum]